MKTIKIELRFDPETDEKEEIVKTAAKMAAKHLWTSALLLGDKRKPQVALYGSDFFSSEEEISLADDIPQEPEESTDDEDAGREDGGADGADGSIPVGG